MNIASEQICQHDAIIYCGAQPSLRPRRLLGDSRKTTLLCAIGTGWESFNAIEKLSADAPEEEVRITCKSSIVPHSRATTTVSEWMKEANERRDARHGTRRYADLGSIAMLLLEHSVPAGYGGLFREAPESRFPSDRSSVWYMHIGGPDALQVYFDDKVQFPQLQTPAEWHAEASCLSVPVI